MLHKDILSEIVENKRLEVARRKSEHSLDELKGQLLSVGFPTRSLRRALSVSDTGIIAEFKRKSPSKGWIHQDARPQDVVPGYSASGASAVSILADEKYFGGSLDYIREMRPLVNVPILCKEFIVDEFQLVEARLAGADAVLLIASCLCKEECGRMIEYAHSIGLETMLELHSEEELEYASLPSDVFGINNRHLGTFHTDVSQSYGMADKLAERGFDISASVWVSESGISSPSTVVELRRRGFRGFLMGETFMREADPASALASFVLAVNENK